MELKAFLETMSLEQRDAFASRCNTSAGHLRNISYGYKTCGEKLAIEIERESEGVVPCEALRPDVDWAYLRSTSPRRGAGRGARSQLS